MSFQMRLNAGLTAIAILLAVSSALAASAEPSSASRAKADKLNFGGTMYLHRWSRNGQNEFTPESDRDLKRWNDMVTINVHETVRDGEQLAALANSVLGNYQKHGKIVRTDSKPRTPQRAAEHLVVAILGSEAFLETTFARVMLRDGVGVVAVYSHRVYGKDAATPVGEWLKSRGPAIEKTLLEWDQIPPVGALRSLPQSP